MTLEKEESSVHREGRGWGRLHLSAPIVSTSNFKEPVPKTAESTVNLQYHDGQSESTLGTRRDIDRSV
jgi:hypothetical protein